MSTKEREPVAVFAALGDATRLRLLTRLAESGPASIAALAGVEPISRQAVTKHLYILAGAGLIRGSRRGREQLWQLDSARLRDARRYLKQIGRQWDGALERLRGVVEEDEAV